MDVHGPNQALLRAKRLVFKGCNASDFQFLLFHPVAERIEFHNCNWDIVRILSPPSGQSSSRYLPLVICFSSSSPRYGIQGIQIPFILSGKYLLTPTNYSAASASRPNSTTPMSVKSSSPRQPSTEPTSRNSSGSSPGSAESDTSASAAPRMLSSVSAAWRCASTARILNH